jgi:putative (di)nucleoside polyphosphate hydrolase
MRAADIPLHLTSLPYRNGVGVMLLNQNNQVFVGKRIDTTSEAWQMPQGGVDPGETPLQAAFRELKEEIGTDKVELLRESADWYTYDLPDELVGKIWGGQYRGQKQKWFAMRLTGTEADINIATPDPEFCEWQWIDIRMLPDMIVPFKRTLYKALVDEFIGLTVVKA